MPFFFTKPNYPKFIVSFYGRIPRTKTLILKTGEVQKECLPNQTKYQANAYELLYYARIVTNTKPKPNTHTTTLLQLTLEHFFHFFSLLTLNAFSTRTQLHDKIKFFFFWKENDIIRCQKTFFKIITSGSTNKKK